MLLKRALAHHECRFLITLFHLNRNPSLNMDASRTGQEIPNGGGRVYHNHDGPTYNVFFHGVAPHTLILGANGNSSEQSALGHIPPQPPQAWKWDLEHITPQPPEASEKDLCHVVINRKANGKRILTFTINHPEIRRSVTGLLDCTNPSHLWQVNYALRTCLRQYGKSFLFAQEADIILRDLEETMRSELQDSIDQDVNDVKGNKRSLYYSIIMLSHGARATISELSISHNVRLDQVLLLSSEKVTLVFTHENQAKSYREIQVSDLPNLKEQGIHLQFESLLKHVLETGKCEHGDECVPHQPPADFEVQSFATSFIGIDEGEEHDATVEDADCVGSGSDPGRTLKLPIGDRQGTSEETFCHDDQHQAKVKNHQEGGDVTGQRCSPLRS
jgi:hypothetical protein